MEIEREVRAVDGQTGRHRTGKFTIKCSLDALCSPPEKSMVDNEQIRPGGGSGIHHRLAGIDGAGHACDVSRILELKAVVRVRIVLDLRGAERSVEIGNEI